MLNACLLLYLKNCSDIISYIMSERRRKMELTCRLLFSRLSEKYPILARYDINDNLVVSGFEFYFGSNMLRKDCVFVADRPDASAALSGFPVIYCGCIPNASEGPWISVQASPAQVTNAVASVFRSYETWENSLKTVVLNRGSVASLLELTNKLLKKPVYFLDSYFVIKASAGTETLPVSKQIFGEEEDHELVYALKHDRAFKEHAGSPHAFFMPSKTLPFDSVMINPGGNDDPNILCAVEDREDEWRNTAEILEALSVYTDYLSKLEENANRLVAGPASVLYELLTDRNCDYDEAISRLEAYGWSDRDEYLCACFLTEGGKTTVGRPDTICRKLGSTYPGSCAFMIDNRMICYFNLSHVDKEIEDFYTEITLLIREYYLRTGYSRTVRGIRHLRRQYRQAEFALERGIEVSPYRWVFHFDEFAPDFLKERVLDSWPPQLLVHPGLEALSRSDAESGTDYMKTLKTMLDCGMSATAAADRLFIHRSTLLYRMEKIKALMGSRLDNPEELTYLSVSYYLLGK